MDDIRARRSHDDGDKDEDPHSNYSGHVAWAHISLSVSAMLSGDGAKTKDIVVPVLRSQFFTDLITNHL
jgi:hypothetical protein